jgi:hypothetical protein
MVMVLHCLYMMEQHQIILKDSKVIYLCSTIYKIYFIHLFRGSVTDSQLSGILLERMSPQKLLPIGLIKSIFFLFCNMNSISCEITLTVAGINWLLETGGHISETRQKIRSLRPPGSKEFGGSLVSSSCFV